MTAVVVLRMTRLPSSVCPVDSPVRLILMRFGTSSRRVWMFTVRCLPTVSTHRLIATPPARARTRVTHHLVASSMSLVYSTPASSTCLLVRPLRLTPWVVSLLLLRTKPWRCLDMYPTVLLRPSLSALVPFTDKRLTIGVRSTLPRTLTPTSSQVVCVPLHRAVSTTTSSSLDHLTASTLLARHLSLLFS